MTTIKTVLNAIVLCGTKATETGGDFGRSNLFYDNPVKNMYFHLENQTDQREQFYSLMKKSGFHSGVYTTPADWYLCFEDWMVVYVDGDIYVSEVANEDDMCPPEDGTM